MVARTDLELADRPVYSIPLSLIDVRDDRLRQLKSEQAAAIGEAMDADGQYDAITIWQPPGSPYFELVEGLHRLKGAQHIGWAVIDARFASSVEREARLRQEVLSAWARADHDVFDKAAQVAALAAQSKVPLGADDEETGVAIIATGARWDVATAEALSISWRSVRNFLTIAETFAGDRAEVLRRTGHADKLVPLLQLAKEEPAVIGKVIVMLAGGFEGSIAEAIDAVWRRQKQDAPTKRFNAVIGNLGRMDERERRGVVDRIVSQYLSDEQLFALADARRRG